MDYERVYNELMGRAKLRGDLCEYSEKHHIKPKCMDGDDSEENIAVLSGREHYVAHRLLTKMYPNKHGLRYAMFCFYNGMNSYQKLNSREYAEARKVISRIHSDKMLIKMSGLSKSERREKFGNSGTNNHFFGKHHNENSKKLISTANSGKTVYVNQLTGETASFYTHSVPPDFVGVNKGRRLSEEEKLQISKFQKGRPTSDETKRRMRASAKNRVERKLKVCPNCGKEGRYNMERYHFENCRK